MVDRADRAGRAETPVRASNSRGGIETGARRKGRVPCTGGALPSILAGVFRGAYRKAVYFFRQSAFPASVCLRVAIPYATAFTAILCDYRPFLGIPLWVLIPPVFWLVSGFLSGVAEQLNAGMACPIPPVHIGRFTSWIEDEVQMPKANEQEAMIYLAQVEDWLEQSGKIRVKR